MVFHVMRDHPDHGRKSLEECGEPGMIFLTLLGIIWITERKSLEECGEPGNLFNIVRDHPDHGAEILG
jgi:hypothetical protein